MDNATTDPKGLIRESYRIEGITPEECRSVFLDWALSLSEDWTAARAIPALLALYEQTNPGHPMNTVLRAGLGDLPVPKRRGGRAGKFGDA